MALLDFITLAQQCAPQSSPATMAAIVRTESGFNPYAIGVVHGRLVRQPATEAEAVATAHALADNGWNFSAGLAQVNRSNWSAYGLNVKNVFEPCRNLAVGAAILRDCFESARRTHANVQSALRASLSCYASGNFSSGYRIGYVQRVVDGAALAVSSQPSVVVPPITPIPVDSETPAERMRSRRIRRAVQDSPGTSGPKPASDPDYSAVVF